jgi:hypothetical protein
LFERDAFIPPRRGEILPERGHREQTECKDGEPY